MKRKRIVGGLVLCLTAQTLGAGIAIAGTMVAFSDKYQCMKNQQRFIGLRAFHTPDGSDVDDPDGFEYEIVTAPSNGELIATASGEYDYDYVYVPGVDFTGTDTFEFTASSGEDLDTGTVTIAVSDSYTPPQGICAPDFGITDSHTMFAPGSGYQYNYGSGNESYHTSNDGPYTHYVDFDLGDDLVLPYGTPENPLSSIPTSLKPGSIVEVHGSQSGDNGALVITRSTTSNPTRPIFIRGALRDENGDPASRPIIKCSMKIEADYVIVENLEFDASEAPSVPAPCPYESILPSVFAVTDKVIGESTWETYSHVAVRHCLFRDYPTNQPGGVAAVFFGVRHAACSPDTNTDLIKYCVAYDISVRDWGEWDSCREDDLGGCGINANTQNIWCLDSLLHHLEGNGTGAARPNALCNQLEPQSVYIGGNHIHHMKENCIAVKLGEKVVVSHNVGYRVRPSESSTGSVLLVVNNNPTTTRPYSDNIWFLYNECYDSINGIRIDNNLVYEDDDLVVGDSKVYCVGNVLYHIQPFGSTSGNVGYGIVQTALVQGTYLNNTLYKCQRGFAQYCYDSEVQDITDYTSTVLVNNVMLDANQDGTCGECTSCEDYPSCGAGGCGGQCLCLVTDYCDRDYHINVCRDAALANMVIDKNIHYESVEGSCDHVEFFLPAELSQYYTTTSSACSYTELCCSSSIANPVFVDAPGLDFHPASSSPCRNAAWVYWFDDVSDEFESVFDCGDLYQTIDGRTFDDEHIPIGPLMYALDPSPY